MLSSDLHYSKLSLISSSSFLVQQNVLHLPPSCHLGVRRTGGLPSSPALDTRLCYPGAQHPWQPGRQHLLPGQAGVFILANGGESCCRAAVWQAGSSEVCSGQQTAQRPTCPGEFLWLMDRLYKTSRCKVFYSLQEFFPGGRNNYFISTCNYITHEP